MTSGVSGIPSSLVFASGSFAPTTWGTSTSFGLHGAFSVGPEPATYMTVCASRQLPLSTYQWLPRLTTSSGTAYSDGGAGKYSGGSFISLNAFSSKVFQMSAGKVPP